MKYFNESIWTDGANVVRVRQVGEYIYTCKDLLTGKYKKYAGKIYWSYDNLTGMLNYYNFVRLNIMFNSFRELNRDYFRKEFNYD